MKNWTVFLIAIGCVLITASPRLPSSVMYMTFGLLLVLSGIVLLFKKRR